jgi:hypothetical protein
VGTTNLQETYSNEEVTTIDCLSPFFEHHVSPPEMLTSPQIVDITPKHAFIDHENITVFVTVKEIYNLSTLHCKF